MEKHHIRNPQRAGAAILNRLGRSASLSALALSFVQAPLPAHAASSPAPIALHPENPHYFLFRGQPTVLITSAEHYGVVLNLDFDYRKYLDTLARDGLNSGLNIQATRDLAKKGRLDVIASGGVRSLEDVKAAFDADLCGVIIGRALYDGTVGLREAIDLIHHEGD